MPRTWIPSPIPLFTYRFFKDCVRRDGIHCGRLCDDRLLPVVDVDVVGRAGNLRPDRERRNLGYGHGRRRPERGI